MPQQSTATASRRRRAISDDQKADRRRAILDAARALFDAGSFAAVSMDRVARRARLAKGTLYLYFPSREAVFLALLTEEFEAFFAALDAALARRMTQAEFADHVARDTYGRLRLRRLIAIMHTVLEHNIDTPTAAVFKRMLARHTRRSGALIEQQVAEIPAAFGPRVLVWLHALVIGLHHMTTPAPVVREVLHAEPALAVFDVDFTSELRALLARLLAAAD